MIETFITVVAVFLLIISGINIYNLIFYIPSETERVLMRYAELMGEDPIVSGLRRYIFISIICIIWIAVWFFK